MVVEKNIFILIEYWKKQRVTILSKTSDEIERIKVENELLLPTDFKEFYQKVNGMSTFYPNLIDDEGFLFYPIEAIVSVGKEFNDSKMNNKERVFIFSEYMHKSWWYAYEVIDSENYNIGIVPYYDTFKILTNSLDEFIQLYLEDSPILYQY